MRHRWVSQGGLYLLVNILRSMPDKIPFHSRFKSISCILHRLYSPLLPYLVLMEYPYKAPRTPSIVAYSNPFERCLSCDIVTDAIAML